MPSATKKDYYETLGVGAERRCGRDSQVVPQARAQIPSGSESGGQSGGRRFKKVQEAYDVLSDDKKRKIYDQYGFYSPTTFRPMPEPAPGSRADMGFEGFDFSECCGSSSRRREQRDFGRCRRGVGGLSATSSASFSAGADSRRPAAPSRSAVRIWNMGLNIDFWQSIRARR